MLSDYLPITQPVTIFAIVAGLILLAPIVLGRWRLPGMIGLLIAGAVLGPNAIGVLDRDTSFVLFGTVGLLYIMFTAALEVDLAVLSRSRFSIALFGLLSFFIPTGLGFLATHYVLGFDWPAALLLASCFGSHTLLTYPIASRLGITRNPASITAVGGTIITDSAALFVLAFVAAIARGGGGDGFILELLVKIAIYIGAILTLLPIVARWFFRNIARDGVSEFVFVLAVVFAVAAAAKLAGSEPIVGAFMAGLALNKLIPHHGPLMNRIRFTGEAIFIPFFLLSVGMLLDVSIFLGGFEAWLVALTMIIMVIVTKWMAAQAASRLLGYDQDQSQVIFGLTVAQAAGTLAAIMVGFELGLFDDKVVNGAILMIFVTCTLAPIVVQRFGRAVALKEAVTPARADLQAPQRIMIGCASGDPSHRLIDLAILLREPGSSQSVLPVRILPATGIDAVAERAARDAMEKIAGKFSEAEVPSDPRLVRAVNVGSGLLRARREMTASDVLIGWPETGSTNELLLGSLIKQLLGDRHFNLFVSRVIDPPKTLERILLVLPEHAEHEEGFFEAVLNVKRLAAQLGAPVHLVASKAAAPALESYFADFEIAKDMKIHTAKQWDKLPATLSKVAGADDLVIVYGVRRGGLAWSPGDSALPSRLVRALPKANILFFFPAEPVHADDEGPSELIDDLSLQAAR
jgi:Kef-type K+ transport system membrane component KefB